MRSTRHVFRYTSAVMVAVLCHPLLVEANPQNEPTSALIEVVQHYDKCETDAKANNLASAKDWCQRGLTVLKKSRVVNDESARLKARLEQQLADVTLADKSLDTHVGTARRLTHESRLESARLKLDELATYQADRRVQEAVSELTPRQAEFDRVLKEAEAFERAGNSKQAHSRYKDAQALDRDASLGPQIKRTGGCYAGCKTAIWVVVLAAVGAGGYYGYQQSKKQK